MNKKEAQELFGFDVEPSEAEAQLRQRQLLAFFLQEEPSKIAFLSKLVVNQIESASVHFTEPAQEKSQTKSESEHQQKKEKPQEKKAPSTKGFLKFLFPQPTDSAGAFLSDQWWRVYKRSVLLGLTFIGAAFLIGPKLVPEPDPYRPPIRHNYDKIDPTKPDDNRYKPISPGDVQEPPALTPQLKSLLDPQANPNPKIVIPSQSPGNFMISLFSAIQLGASLERLVEQPPSSSVQSMLAQSHRLVNFANLPEDAISVVSNEGGTAKVRVKEAYFTTGNALNDYYLKSDNGVWKLTEIREAASP